jgi:gluconate 5-dehydrogenase
VNGDLFDLTGKRAVITGSGSGLGLSMARALAVGGACVVLVGRDHVKLQSARDMIGQERASIFLADLTERADISGLIGDVLAEGPVDILVNNAGVQHRAPVATFPEAAWDTLIATHLTAAFLLAKGFVPHMTERGSGKIINVLSVNAQLGRPSIVPYATAKGGLKMLTRGLAVELGPSGVQVNGLAPGYFRTEMTASLIADPEFDTWLRNRTPARRWGEPQDLDGAIRFLASRSSDYVNGQVLYVDGGLTAAV